MTSLDHPRLFGLGRNPAASQDVLVRLAAHGAGRHGISLRRGQLPDAVVEALLTHGDGDTAVSLHGDRISPAMRRRIAAHPDPVIRDAYADFVRHCVDREAMTDINELEEAYGQPRTALAAAPDPKLRAAVARAWHDRPLGVQLGLLADPDPLVRAAATERKQPGVPPEWIDRCLADPAMRVNVARYVPLTLEQFAQLMRTEVEEVYQVVAGNPHLSADMVARLSDIDDPIVRVVVAQSRHVDTESRNRLYALVEAERVDGSVAAEVALSLNRAEPDWLPATTCPRRHGVGWTTTRNSWSAAPPLAGRTHHRRFWNGWYASTATYSTSDRCSSSTPTFPVARCAPSSTNRTRMCSTSPCRIMSYP